MEIIFGATKSKTLSSTSVQSDLVGELVVDILLLCLILILDDLIFEFLNFRRKIFDGRACSKKGMIKSKEK